MVVTLFFLIFKYLVVALLLAYFTSVFMKKKEVKVDVKATKLEMELQAEIRIHKLIMELEHHIAPALKTETLYDDILDWFDFKMDPTLNSYPICFDSPDLLTDYHERLLHEKERSEPFLDYRTKDILESMLSWLDDINEAIGLFIKVESDRKWNYSPDVQKENALIVCHMFGLALQSDISRFESTLSNRFKRKLRTPSLLVWRQFTISDRINKLLSDCIDKKIDNNISLSKFEQWLYYGVLHRLYGRSELSKKSRKGKVSLLLMIVHYLHEFDYDVDKIFELSKGKDSELIDKFYESLQQCQ